MSTTSACEGDSVVKLEMDQNPVNDGRDCVGAVVESIRHNLRRERSDCGTCRRKSSRFIPVFGCPFIDRSFNS